LIYYLKFYYPQKASNDADMMNPITKAALYFETIRVIFIINDIEIKNRSKLRNFRNKQAINDKYYIFLNIRKDK